MTQPETGDDLVTISEIAEIAGTARPTVSNWKRRHDDFPAPRAEGLRGPLFSRSEVLHWLQANGKLATLPLTLLPGDPGTEFSGGLDVLRERVPVSLMVATGMALLADGDLPDGLPDDVRALMELLRGSVDKLTTSERQRLARGLVARAQLAGGRDLAGHTVPETVRSLMVGLLGGRAAVYDPACGYGTLLDGFGGTDPSPSLFGQEHDQAAARVARDYLEVLGVDADVRPGNALVEDVFSTQRFAGIVSAPPFRVRYDHTSLSSADPRWTYMVPGRDGDSAWLQHVLYHLEPEGRAVVLVPGSFLFVGGPVGRLRDTLVRVGHVRAVVQLPPGALLETHIATAVVVLDKTPPADVPTVLVGAPDIRAPRRSIGGLDPSRAAEVTEMVRDWLDGVPVELTAEFAQVDLEQLAAVDFSLDPRRLLAPATADVRPLIEVRNELDKAVADAADYANRLTDRFPELVAHLPVEPEPSPRTALVDLPGVTVERGLKQGDLVKEGKFPVHTAASLLGGHEPSRFLPEDHELLQSADLQFNVHSGDLLVALEGHSGMVGRTVIASEDMFVSSQFAVIRVGDGDVTTHAETVADSLTARYLAQWLDSPEARAELNRLTTGNTLERISLKDFRSLAVPVPPQGTQQSVGAAHHLLYSARHWLNALTETVANIETLAAESVAAALPEEGR